VNNLNQIEEKTDEDKSIKTIKNPLMRVLIRGLMFKASRGARSCPKEGWTLQPLKYLFSDLILSVNWAGVKELRGEYFYDDSPFSGSSRSSMGFH